jgi:hypothetical protein
MAETLRLGCVPRGHRPRLKAPMAMKAVILRRNFLCGLSVYCLTVRLSVCPSPSHFLAGRVKVRSTITKDLALLL